MSSLARERLASTRAASRSATAEPSASAICSKCGRAVFGRATKRGNHPACPRRKRKRGTPAKSRKAHRHQKVDREATAKRHFLDKRSFVNLKGLPFLYGQDMRVMRDAVLSRDDFRCVECGEHPDYGNHTLSDCPLEIDHIASRGKGGADNMDNLQTLCRGCHVKKHGRVVGGSKRSAAA